MKYKAKYKLKQTLLQLIHTLNFHYFTKRALSEHTLKTKYKRDLAVIRLQDLINLGPI